MVATDRSAGGYPRAGSPRTDPPRRARPASANSRCAPGSPPAGPVATSCRAAAVSREIMPARGELRVRPRPRPDAADASGRHVVPAGLPAPLAPAAAQPAPASRRRSGPPPPAPSRPGTAPAAVPPEADARTPTGGHRPRPDADRRPARAARPDSTGLPPLDADPAGRRPAGRRERTTPRSTGRPAGRARAAARHPASVVALAVACLVVGALGGSGWSQQQAQRNGRRHPGLPLDGRRAGARRLGLRRAGTRLRVTLMATGAPVSSSGSCSARAEGSSEAGVTLRARPGDDRRPGAAPGLHRASPRTAAARRRPVRPSRRGAPGRLAARPRRCPSTSSPTPRALMLSLLAPCSPAAQQTAAEAGPPAGVTTAGDPGVADAAVPALTVSGCGERATDG